MDRFYRGGDTNSPGSGLGLAIIQSIAKIHGGEVRLGSSKLGGLSVSVHFWQSHATRPITPRKPVWRIGIEPFFFGIVFLFILRFPCV